MVNVHNITIPTFLSLKSVPEVGVLKKVDGEAIEKITDGSLTILQGILPIYTFVSLITGEMAIHGDRFDWYVKMFRIEY